MSSNLDVGPFVGGNTAVFQDVQVSGVSAQSISSNTDTVVQFNTTVDDKSFVTRTGNQFALDEGVYDIVFVMPQTPSASWGLVWAKDTSNVSYGGSNFGIDTNTGPKYIGFRVNIPAGGKTIEILMHTGTGTISLGLTQTPTNGNEYYQQLYITPRS